MTKDNIHIIIYNKNEENKKKGKIIMVDNKIREFFLFFIFSISL